MKSVIFLFLVTKWIIFLSFRPKKNIEIKIFEVNHFVSTD